MAGPPVPGDHVLLYDGVCGLCSRLVQFLLEHDHRAVFVFASLQSTAGKAIVERFGGNPEALTTFYVLTGYRTERARLLSRSRAALFVAGQLGWPWKLAVVLRVLPAEMLDGIYDFTARRRYRLFGQLEQCLMPQPEFRGRFLDT